MSTYKIYIYIYIYIYVYIYIYIFIYVLYIYILNLIAKKSIPRQQKPEMHTGRSLGQADPIEQHFNSKQLTR